MLSVSQNPAGKEINQRLWRLVKLDKKRYSIVAQVHTLSCYSAHVDLQNLVSFVRRMRKPPKEVVHGASGKRSGC